MNSQAYTKMLFKVPTRFSKIKNPSAGAEGFLIF